MDDFDDYAEFDPFDSQPTPLEGCADDSAAYRLRNLMGDISEDHYAAGWLIGLEYMLFGAVYADDHFGGFQDGLSFEEKKELLTLSQRCQGWWMWSDGHGGREFVPFDRWFKIYQAHMERG